MLLNAWALLPAQDQRDSLAQRPLNSINLNLLGDASLIALNYERAFVLSPDLILTSKIGLGYNEEFQICIFGPCVDPPSKYRTIPHHLTANFGKGTNLFEIGLGGTKIYGDTRQPYLFYPIVGFRVLPLKSGKANFRLFVQLPFSGLETDGYIFIPIGLNFGTSF